MKSLLIYSSSVLLISKLTLRELLQGQRRESGLQVTSNWVAESLVLPSPVNSILVHTDHVPMSECQFLRPLPKNSLFLFANVKLK